MEGGDLFSSLFSDPAALQRAVSAAASLLGNADEGTVPPAGQTQPAAQPEVSGAFDPAADLIRTAMPVLGRIAQSGQAAVDPNKRNLLAALKPFLGSRAAGQIDHGIKLVSLARMATAAMGQLADHTGEEGHHV